MLPTVYETYKKTSPEFLLMPGEIIVRARFVRRPNRFVVICELNGCELEAYMPNPGRLWELLFPGVVLLLAPSRGGKMSHVVMAIESGDGPILLHTHLNNNVARWLLEQRLVPGLEEASVVRAEYPFGDSRFDFLLRRGEKKILVEVKSCTLFRGSMSMFPDAVSARATRHLKELLRATEEGWETAVLILAHSGAVTRFLPEYHTDLNFARTLIDVRDRVKVIPLGLSWGQNLELSPDVKELEVPWKFLKSEAHDCGSYMIVLELEEDKTISIGDLGNIFFKKGFYVYVGSAINELQKRIDSHRRFRKKHRWHIDYLRQDSSFVSGMAVRASNRIECELARAVERIALDSVPGFGSVDGDSLSFLFRFSGDPRKDSAFIDLLMDFRMTRLDRG